MVLKAFNIKLGELFDRKHEWQWLQYLTLANPAEYKAGSSKGGGPWPWDEWEHMLKQPNNRNSTIWRYFRDMGTPQSRNTGQWGKHAKSFWGQFNGRKRDRTTRQAVRIEGDNLPETLAANKRPKHFQKGWCTSINLRNLKLDHFCWTQKRKRK